MPYLTDEDKRSLSRHTLQPRTAGQLTYTLQQDILCYLGRRPNYQAMAEVLGALEGVKADFVERILKPYEHKKRMENGDVWPTELLEHCLDGWLGTEGQP